MFLKKNKIHIFVVLLIIIAFRPIFSLLNLNFGDSPNFDISILKTYLEGPFLWTPRVENFGGIAYADLILTYLMKVYALLGVYLKIPNELITRILFYLPTLLLSYFGMLKLSGEFIQDRSARVVSSVYFIFNTYFLLLIDGGQVGVSLGYSLLPFLLYYSLKITKLFKTVDYFIFSILLFLLFNIEIRFIAFFIFAYLILAKFKIKNLIAILLSLFSTIGVSLYWLYPFFKSPNVNTSFISDLNIMDLKSVFTVFHPLWPLNEFGLKQEIPIFYFLVPMILFTAVLVVKNSSKYRIVILLILSAFLLKGTNPPLGQIYALITERIPFGVAFRDSTKFFVPLIISVSLLLGLLSEYLSEKLKKAAGVIPLAFIIFIALLVYPAFTGGLTGILKVIPDKPEITFKKGDYARLWFPEKPAYIRELFPITDLNANTLYRKRPYAILIEGTYDKYYYLWNPLFKKLLSLSNIEYLGFSPNYRKKLYSDQEIIDRQQFLSEVKDQQFGDSVGIYGYPIYRKEDGTGKVFSAKKAVFVLGSDDIYFSTFNGDINFQQIPFVFMDDSNWQVEDMLKLDKNDAFLVFNRKDESDFTYRVLSEKRVLDINSVLSNNWGYKKDVVDWRNEMKKAGIIGYDFDQQRGLFFSNYPSEEIKFDFNLDKSVKLSFVVKGITQGEGMEVSVDNKPLGNIQIETNGDFGYVNLGDLDLQEGEHTLAIKNLGGFSAVNFVEYFSKEEFIQAEQTVKLVISKFPRITKINPSAFKENYQNIEYKQTSPVSYTVKSNNNPWLVLVESYDKGWEIGNNPHFQAYSFINLFYLSKDNDLSNKLANELEIYFRPQDLIKDSWLYTKIGIAVNLIIWITLFVFRKRIENYLNA